MTPADGVLPRRQVIASGAALAGSAVLLGGLSPAQAQPATRPATEPTTGPHDYTPVATPNVNPLPWRREGPVEFDLHTPVDPTRLIGQNERPKSVRLTDEAGREIPCQLGSVAHTGAGYRLRLVADLGPTGLPGLGYRALGVEYLSSGEGTTPAAGTAPELANEYLVARFDPKTGWLISLVDRGSGVDLLAGPAAVPVVLDDPSDTWSHGVAGYHEEIGRFAANGDIALIERGPLRSAVRVCARWGASEVEQVFSLAAGARQVEVSVRVDWRERWRALKLAFPFALREAVATAEVPYGSISRPTGGHEESMQRWLDVTGTDLRGAAFGVSLLNDGKYAYDVLGAEARLTVLRSPAYAFHRPREVEPGVEYEFVDQGEQRFRYAIRPHRGALADAAIPRAAWALNEPIIVHREAAHPGEAPAPRGFLEVSPASVLASVVKRAESGGGFVLRLVETSGRPTTAQFAFAGWGPDSQIAVALGPHEVKSLRWSDAFEEIDLLEETGPYR
jgi:alpha-mannosidase